MHKHLKEEKPTDELTPFQLIIGLIIISFGLAIFFWPVEQTSKHPSYVPSHWEVNGIWTDSRGNPLREERLRYVQYKIL